jgi:hypothetical protein
MANTAPQTRSSVGAQVAVMECRAVAVVEASGTAELEGVLTGLSGKEGMPLRVHQVHIARHAGILFLVILGGEGGGEEGLTCRRPCIDMPAVSQARPAGMIPCLPAQATQTGEKMHVFTA